PWEESGRLVVLSEHDFIDLHDAIVHQPHRVLMRGRRYEPILDRTANALPYRIDGFEWIAPPQHIVEVQVEVLAFLPLHVPVIAQCDFYPAASAEERGCVVYVALCSRNARIGSAIRQQLAGCPMDAGHYDDDKHVGLGCPL